MNRHQRRTQARTAPAASLEVAYARAAAYYCAGHLHEAERACRDVLLADPAHARALYMMGMLAFGAAEYGDAAALIGQALSVEETVEARNDLGLTLRALGRFEDAIVEHRRAVALRPGIGIAHYNLSACLLEIGLIDDAMAELHEAALLGHVPAGTIQQLLYRPGVTLPEILAAAQQWAERCLPPPAPVLELSARTVPRIGFISGDFYTHTVGLLVYPSLRALADRGIEFTLYSNSARNDAHTNKIRDAAKTWRDIYGLPDEAVRDRIIADGIDILVDLSGHTDNRAAVLARRAAPIQVTWLGSAATSGIPAMDYILADRHQIPPGAEAHYSEKVVRLPDSYVTFDPPQDAPELANLVRSPVTFGSFNALKKIGPEVLAAWSRILERVPDSRIIIKAPGADGPLTKARLLAALAVVPERVYFVGTTSRQGHLEWMARADIALDSFTYSGGQTTLECLWMGLPVIALPDKETFAGRHSLGYLSTLGLADEVASDVDDYIARAASLSRYPVRISLVSAELRQRLLASPLCDHDAFAGHLEAAFARMWEIHRGGTGPAAFNIGGE